MKAKSWYVVLLFVACIILGYYHYSFTPSYVVYPKNHEEVDSLISHFIQPYVDQEERFRTYTVRFDSIDYERSVYRFTLTEPYSSTDFHFKLHHKFKKHGLEAPAIKYLSDKNMSIHITYKNRILSTLSVQY